MVDAGIIGSLALIATSGAPPLPMRSTTSPIDESGTGARASAAMTVAGSGPAGTFGAATRWTAFDFFAAARLGVGFCASVLEPPPFPPRASTGVFIAKARVAAAMTKVAVVRQRLVSGFFLFRKAAVYMWSDRDGVMSCDCADCRARVPQAVRVLYGGSAYGFRFAGFQRAAQAKSGAWASARRQPFGQRITLHRALHAIEKCLLRRVHLASSMPQQVDVDIGQTLFRRQSPQALLREVVAHNVLRQAANAVPREDQPPYFVQT